MGYAWSLKWERRQPRSDKEDTCVMSNKDEQTPSIETARVSTQTSRSIMLICTAFGLTGWFDLLISAKCTVTNETNKAHGWVGYTFHLTLKLNTCFIAANWTISLSLSSLILYETSSSPHTYMIHRLILYLKFNKLISLDILFYVEVSR